MEQGPAARQQHGVPDISLAALGAWQGVGLGAFSAVLYGWSVVVLMGGIPHLVALIVTTVHIAWVGVLPSALLGGMGGAIVGHRLCRLPLGATAGHAAALGTTITGAGVLVLHGCWLLAGGEITLAGGLEDNAYLFYLGAPSGMAVLLGALGAVGLYHQMDRAERMLPRRTRDD